MARFLITGGAGFIGSHIAEGILAQGLGDVLVFDDLSTGHADNIRHMKRGITFVQGDVRDEEALTKACEGVEVVFHEAAFVSAFDSFNKTEFTEDINVGGTLNVLKAAGETGVRRVVLASSAATYGPKSILPNREDMDPAPGSPYADSKIEGERLARRFAEERGLETVCLRYFNVYGPRQDPSSEYSGVISRFVEAAGRGEAPVIYGDGKQTRDFIYAGDVARANILAAFSERTGKGEAINIGTGRETSLLDIIDALGNALDRKIEPRFEPVREGDIPRSVADVSRAREILDFTAEVDFTEGIRRLVG